MTPRRVLITGSASGIGRALAGEMTRRGYHVIAADKNVEGLDDVPAAQRCALDLTSPTSIQELVARVRDVDILVNNAGVGIRGPVETVPITSVREQFEVMFFGPLALVQAFVPGMRERGRGLIVNVSSGMAGPIVRPLFSFYSAAKMALESISEGLWYELDRFGVRVLVIQPGNVVTNFRTALRREGHEGAYAALAAGVDRFRASAQQAEYRTMPDDFARQVADAIEHDDGRLRVPIGADAVAAVAQRRAQTDAEFRDIVRSEFVPA